MNDKRKSKTSLVLMELMISILFFSLASAVCIQLFVKAHQIGQQTKELNFAMKEAQCFAEIMRGTDGSLESIMAVYPGCVPGDGNYFDVFYDENFNQCVPQEAVYVSDVTLTATGAIQNMDIKVVKLENYEHIYSLTATKYMNIPKG